jgi:hypothetical protein
MITIKYYILDGERPRHREAGASIAQPKTRGRADHPPLQPEYFCIHPGRQSSREGEVCLLIQEIITHQKELSEGHL